MNPPRITISVLVAIAALSTLTTQAQIYKANVPDSLDSGSSWTGGVAPGTTDIAAWDSTVSTAANCSNTLAAAASWGGIQMLNPIAGVKIPTNTANPTLSIGASGIDLSGASVDLWVAPSMNTVADQVWSIAGGRTLTIGENGKNNYFQNNVWVNGHLTYVNNIRVRGGGTVYVTNSATTIESAAGALSAAQVLVGYDAAGGTVIQTNGTVKIKRTDGSSGSPNAGLVIASQSSSVGIYTITGGLLTDVNTGNSSYFAVANGAGSTGTLNVDGTGAIQALGLRLGNQNTTVATVNLTNGSIILTGTGSAGEVDIGRTSTAGQVPGPSTLNIYGGTFSALGNVMVPHGNGPGFVNLYGGSMSVNGSVNVADSTATASGALTINGGTLTITNSLNLPSGSTATASGVVTLNAGILTLNSVAHPGTASGTLIFNGGTLRARQASTTFINAGVTAIVSNGVALIDTAGYNATIPAALLHGSGATDGGLTKQGLGTLTLSGANTYNGPTTLNAGALYLYTTNFAGGSLSVSNAALLHVIIGSAGSTLNCSSLALGTLGASLGGGITNEFDFDGFPNPAIPIISTPSFAAAGTVVVNVTGTGLAVGTYHLIQYSGSISGSDYAFAAGIISGAVGYVTNNTATHNVDLVVTGLPSLVWRAQVNTNWDTTTANWVDLGSGLPTTYPNGASVLFDDSTANPLVYATANWAPATLTLNNSGKTYTFTGPGHITGIAGLTKQNGGTVLMGLTNNDYSGATIISNGVFKTAGTNVIPNGTGKGDVTLEGTLDLDGFSQGINGLTGYSGLIDNSGGGPVTLTMGNGGGSGTFAGQITNSLGSLALNITGGNFLLLARNGYAGGTTSRGSLQLAYEQSIGTGSLTLQGTLLWTDTAAHTLTNPMTLSGGITFGAATNGPLTVPGTVNLAGGGRAVTCNTDVLFQNGATNGGFSGKAGTGTFTLKRLAGPDWLSGSFGLNNGTLVLDNAAAVEHTNNFRIQCNVSGGMARMVLTNGASLTLADGPSSNFRFGDGGAADVTNQLDLAGTLNVVAYAGANNKFQMGSSTDPAGYNIANLLPGGVLRARQILDQAGNNISTFNFDGGTLSPNTNDLGNTFMQNLDSCYIQDRGAIIDTAGWDITIAQVMQSGGSGVGGLTKQGAGTLHLNGANSFSGLTHVSAGGLGGIGSLSGPVTVASGATLAPGGGANGTPFSIYNSVTLAGGSTTLMEINADTASADRLNGVSDLYCGGTLVVTNIGASTPALGQTYYLFTVSTYHGAFASVVLPPLPSGFGWNLSNLTVDGTIRVASQPVITSIVLQDGTNIVVSGTNGTAFTPYYVLASTNVALPLSNWTPIATNSFDDLGNLNFTNVISPTSHRLFYNLQVP
jgi:autotransporter-associated beta strand protein